MRSKSFLLAFAIIICLLYCVRPVPADPPTKTWASVRSTNFLVLGSVSGKRLGDVAIRLEQFHQAFSHLLPSLASNSASPTTVIVFETDAAYTPFKPLYHGQPQDVAGYFQTGHDLNYITIKMGARGSDPYRTIFHEYVHQLLNDALGELPRWFDEGLAEYYSTLEVHEDGRKVLLGRELPSHVSLLRREPLFPLDILFAVDHNSPYYHERDKNGIFYAESWELMHYFMQWRQPQLKQLFSLLRAGTPFNHAYSRAFPESNEILENALAAYTRQKLFITEEIGLDHRLDFVLDTQKRTVTEAEAEAYLGDLLLHIDRLDEALVHLEHALALNPALAMAQSSLGIVLVRQKRFDRAIDLLKESVAAAPLSYLAHYYYAYGLSRERVDDKLYVTSYMPEQAEIMRTELRRSIELAPDFPDAYYLLAFVNIVNDENLDESIAMLTRALILSPRRQEFKLLLAQTYLKKRDTGKARTLLEQMLDNASTAEIRSRVNFLMNSASTVDLQSAALKSRSYPATAVRGIEGDVPDLAPPTLESALRKPREGERRVSGRLTAVECAPSKITFAVTSGSRTMNFDTDALSSVTFITYTPSVRGEFTCGKRSPPIPVVITYRSAKNARPRVEGKVVTLEFVPEDFKLKIEDHATSPSGPRPDQ